MKFELARPEAHGGGPRKVRVEVAVSTLVVVCVVLVLGVVWSFIFGVLVGRGYQPEEKVPSLAEIMPAKPDKEHTAAAPQEAVIKPEELQFFDRLKDKTEPATTPVERTTEGAAPAASSGSSTARATVETSAAQEKPARPPIEKVEKPKASEARAVKVERKAEPAKATAAASSGAQDDESGSGTFDYVYQIASVTDESRALRYRDKVRTKGLRSEVEKVTTDDGKTWHRIVVHFRGRPEDTRQMKALLQELGVEKPLLKSKKPL